jgi:ornithine cyclodeaminase
MAQQQQQQQEQSLPRVVTLSEIEEVVSSDGFATRLVDAILEGFVSYSRGDFNAPPIQTMGAPPMAPFEGRGGGGDGGGEYSAQTCVKSGYLASSSHYVVKVASGGRPFPANSGNVQLYSQSTGALVAIFLDDGLLTELRTAAAGAAAARLLSPDLLDDGRPTSSTVGVVGTGMQARHQLRYLKCVTDCRRALVWGRTESNVRKFVEDMSAEGWDVRSVGDADDLLDSCGLIVTTTSSRAPLLGGARGARRRPLHVTCVGSDSTGKKELDDAFVASADLLVADSRLQTAERGEFEDAVRSGLVDVGDVVEIGELAHRRALHRGRGVGDDGDCRLTIFDSSGVAVQDCVIASMVYESLRR